MCKKIPAYSPKLGSDVACTVHTPSKHVLKLPNSEAGDNFEIMRVCMGKRNLAQSCALYEVTPNNKSHACEPLGILKPEAEDNFEIIRVCMGKRNLAQSCVLYEVTPNKQVTCMCTTWKSQTQKQETTLKL